MSVTITVGQIIVWVIVGALAGSLAGVIVKRRREGFGRFNNLIVGLVGAVIGGFIFKLFGIDLGLGQIAINFEDLISAFVGSLIFLGIVWSVQKRSKTL